MNLPILLFAILASLSLKVRAETSSGTGTSLDWIIDYGLSHSSDVLASKAETQIQQSLSEETRRGSNWPKTDFGASFQSRTYERPFLLGGEPRSNNGSNPIFGLTVAYDLQKILGSQIALTTERVRYAKIQEIITRRDTVRSIKKAYFTIQAIESNIAVMKKIIGLFDRINNILEKQRSLGVKIDIERRQFNVQKNLLAADLSSVELDEDAAYNMLSSASRLPLAEARARIGQNQTAPKLRYASRSDLDPKLVDSLSDGAILESLGRDYTLARIEKEKFVKPLWPVVYGKISHEAPTMLSADGPQTILEVGISIPIDTLYTKNLEKSRLLSQEQKAQALFEKSVQDYRNNVRFSIESLQKLKAKSMFFGKTRDEAKELLENSFLYYAQKRIDVIATLDIFQKYLQSERQVLANDLQIQSLDADLEYLIGSER
jgi:outer membrane protein TolC